MSVRLFTCRLAVHAWIGCNFFFYFLFILHCSDLRFRGLILSTSFFFMMTVFFDYETLQYNRGLPLSHFYSLFILFIGMYVLAISFLGYGITRKHDTDELG